jgi:serine phosphatase RsbU (regulator of sigma subunit)
MFFANYFFGQNYLDTIAIKIKKAKNDSVKIDVYYKSALAKDKLNSKQRDSLNELVLETGKNSPDKKLLSYALFKQGYYHNNRNESSKAIEKYFLALKEAEKVKNIYVRLISHNRIGFIYADEKNTKGAVRQYHYSIPLAKMINDSNDLSDAYSSLGTIYNNTKLFDSSLFYHFKALEIRLMQANRKNLAITYNGIGLTYKGLKDYDKAIDFLKKSLEIRIEVKDKKGEAGSKINIGNVLNLKGDYTKALEYLLDGTDIAYKNKAGDFYCSGLLGIKNSYSKAKKWKECSLAWDKYKMATDSVKGEKIKKDILELEAKYDSDRKDADLKLQEEQIRSKIAENSKQKILIVASIIALLMALIAVFFIYRSFRLNKRNAIQLAFKNHLIEEKNKEITDSINYARLIQQSLLASETMLNKNLKEHFILYKPKDIVSGDFYWAAETDKGFLLACVDCTGHGVPGAFMSLIGKENLDKAIVKTNSPKEILSELNKGVKRSLNQNSGNGNRDGMDVAIVRIEKEKDGRSKVVYSGANRPCWIIKNGTTMVEEIKATKQAIGGFTKDEQEFDEHELILQTGDSVFISTDGYADQFGSEKNKKMTTKRFKELLISTQVFNSADQKNKLEEFFSTWKGKNEQLDDLLVIGIKM